MDMFRFCFSVQEQLVFKRHDEFPFSKLLTVEKPNEFSIDAFYANCNELPYPDSFIGIKFESLLEF